MARLTVRADERVAVGGVAEGPGVSVVEAIRRLGPRKPRYCARHGRLYVANNATCCPRCSRTLVEALPPYGAEGA